MPNVYRALTEFMNPKYSYFLEIFKAVVKRSIVDNKVDWSKCFDEYCLNGGRFGGKTFNVASFIGLLYLFTYDTNFIISTYALRLNNVQCSELKQEIDNALARCGLIENTNKFKFNNGNYILKNGNTYRFPNGSMIKIKGIYSANSDAISFKGSAGQNNSNLIIRWIEEANEVSKEEFQAVDAAVRGNKDTKIIKINTSNPDIIFQYYPSYCNNLMLFNELLLDKNGEQIGYRVIDEYDERTKQTNKKRILLHYTNWLINIDNMSQDAINEMLELKRLDPVKYRIWGLGMPRRAWNKYICPLFNRQKDHKLPTNYVLCWLRFRAKWCTNRTPNNSYAC